MTAYDTLFCDRGRPLAPLPTNVAPHLTRLTDIRVVLFDIYGTLLISASGDVGTDTSVDDSRFLTEAFTAAGLPQPRHPELAHQCLLQTIKTTRAAMQEQGVDHPEINIITSWRAVLDTLLADGEIDHADVDVKRLAVEYEVRTNPVWPMPGARQCLETLMTRGTGMGLISNAQFYTPIALRAMFENEPSEIGIDPALVFFSYRFGVAKPDVKLFELARNALANRGVSPPEVLYVGNDMRKDIITAHKAGFRAALFAGDQRSYRIDASEAVQPDLIVTHLLQLPGCLA